MSDTEDLFGCIGIILAVVAIVLVVALAVQILAAVGALYGGGIALRNYGLAFQHNVRPERRAAA